MPPSTLGNLPKSIENLTSGVTDTIGKGKEVIDSAVEKGSTLAGGIEKLKNSGKGLMHKAKSFGETLLADTIEITPKFDEIGKPFGKLLAEQNAALDLETKEFEDSLGKVLEPPAPKRLFSKEKALRLDKTMDIAHIEDDLSSYPEEKLISPENKEVAISNACENVLSKFGKYIDPTEIQNVFPGIDLEEIDKYDFNESKTKTFVLDSDTFHEVRQALYEYGGSDQRIVGSHIPNPESASEKSEFFRVGNTANLTGIILINGKESIMGQENDTHLALEETIRHEMLHSLKVGDYLPDAFSNEGLVEYLTMKSAPKLSNETSTIADESIEKTRSPIRTTYEIGKAFAEGSYTPRVAAFVSMHKSIAKEGWTNDSFYEALISEDKQKHRKLANAVLKTAGKTTKDYANLLYEVYKYD